MALYSMRVSMIGRSSGRSSTAAAAYRAGVAIMDERTGLKHDYTRKRGVVHAEIMTPDKTPDWMQDRAQLWNAVEKVETRSNSQLAREIMVALPHELNDEQRVKLVQGFVREQCIARGMIADICIHRPNPHEAADERNHHAHIMLTTREFVGEAWAKNKNRDWHDRSMIDEWREAWADHQNKTFEKMGLDVRVDHRSLADQGILREPTQHLGPVANEIERSGRKSHVGNDNRAVADRNQSRADLEKAGNVVDAKIAFEKRKFDYWAETKREALQQETEEQRALRQIRVASQMQVFERQLDQEFGERKDVLSTQHRDVSERLATGGWRKFIRDITLTTRKERKEQERIESDLSRIKAAEDKKRAAFEASQAARKANAEASFAKKKADLERGIGKAQARREQTQWSPRPSDQLNKTQNDKPPVEPHFNRASKDEIKPVQGDSETAKGGRIGKTSEQARAEYVEQQKQVKLTRPAPPKDPKYELPPRKDPSKPLSAKEEYMREQRAAAAFKKQKDERER